MAYRDFKYLARGTAVNKFLRDKAFNISKNLNYDGYQRSLASMLYIFFDKETTAEELHKPITEKLKTENYIHHLKTVFWFKDNR